MAKGSHRYHKMLTVTELEKLTTPRLLNVLKIARSLEQNEINRSHCECCNMPILDLHESTVNRIKSFTAYKERIKKILATREHV